MFTPSYLSVSLYQGHRRNYLKQFKNNQEIIAERDAVQLQMKTTNYSVDTIEKMSFLVKSVTDLKFLCGRVHDYIEKPHEKSNHGFAKNICASICYDRQDPVTTEKWSHIWFDGDTEDDNKAVTKVLCLFYDYGDYAQVQKLYKKLREPHIDHHLVFTAACYKSGTVQDFATLWEMRQNNRTFNTGHRGDSILSLFAIDLDQPGIALDCVRSYLHNRRVPPTIKLNLILYCHLKNRRIEDAISFLTKLIKNCNPTTSIMISADNWKSIEEQHPQSFQEKLSIHLQKRIVIEKTTVLDMVLRPISRADAHAVAEIKSKNRGNVI